MTKVGSATVEYNGVDLALAGGGVEMSISNRPYKPDNNLYKLFDDWSSMSFTDYKIIQELQPGDLIVWVLSDFNLGKIYWRVVRRDFKRNKVWVRRDWDYVDK